MRSSFARSPVSSIVQKSRAVALGLSLLSACSATQPLANPSSPPPAPAPSPAQPTPAPRPVEVAPASVAPAAAEPNAASPPPAESTALERSQKPLDMITARDAAFHIDYANSAPKQAAQAACEKEAKGVPETLGACLSKAREQFQPDVLRFRKDSETQTSLLIYKRSGATLRELAVAVVQLTEEGDTIRVKFAGRYKGARPLWRGRAEGTLRVPNDYSIEIDDPELGQLRYDAKIGLVTE